MSHSQRSLDTETVEADAADAAEGLADCALDLLLVGADGCTQVVPMRESGAVTIGRGQGACVQVEDAQLSRLHARAAREGNRVRIVDLNSRNGIRVDGAPVRDVLLCAGDVAVLGSTTVSLRVRSSSTAAALGLLGRDAMLHALEREWARSRHFRRPFSVLVVRSREGAGAAAFSKRVIPVMRARDLLGVHDQQTLVALLPETHAEAARRLADQLQATAGPRDPAVICSIAAYPQTQLTPESLLKAAFAAQSDPATGPCVRMAREAGPVRGPQTGPVIRENRAMLALHELVARIAPRRIPVLVTGETGVGKELVANDLHALSDRRSALLRVVNCAAIPDTLVESVLFGHVRGAFTGADRACKGLFEQAAGGTVFLDEIGELSSMGQAALLRVLDTGRLTPVGGHTEVTVDVRVVAATHRDLEAMVTEGRFRLDLLHRLNAVVLTVPPLRERPDEIRALAEQFAAEEGLAHGQARYQLSTGALARLQAHAWPGNVRELRNIITRAAALSDGEILTEASLPPHIGEAVGDAPASSVSPVQGTLGLPNPTTQGPFSRGLDLRGALAAHERRLIQDALREVDGNQRRAAALLGLPLRTFERKVHKHALRAGEGRS